jgi:sortase (surface protein transpeptidase)
MWKIREHGLMYVYICMMFGLILSGSSLYPGGSQRPAISGNIGQSMDGTLTRLPTSIVPAATPVTRKIVRLLIPAVHIDAPIEPVGLVAGKYLAVPTRNQWDGVGWYRYGPLPGEQGNAVIDGHLDRPGGLPAIFWNLHKLRANDIVTVIDAGGKAWHFRVTATMKYAPGAAPLDKIFGNVPGAHLNLITCSGQWIASEHQNSLRLVVYTEMI